MVVMTGMRVKVGDTVRLPMTTDKSPVNKEGKVVWISPKGRFFRVEFVTKLGKIYECYPYYGEIRSGVDICPL